MKKVYYINGVGEICFSNVQDDCVSIAIEESSELAGNNWTLSIFNFMGVHRYNHIAALRSSEAYYIHKLIHSNRFKAKEV